MQPAADDIMIILGNAAFNYAGNKHDVGRKTYVNGLGMTVFSIHGLFSKPRVMQNGLGIRLAHFVVY